MSVSALLSIQRLKYAFLSFPNALGGSSLDSFFARKRLFRKVAYLENQLLSIEDTTLHASQMDDASHRRIVLDRSKFFPISFSWPGPLEAFEDLHELTRKPFSIIFPGEPYGFTDYKSYLEEYRSSVYGTTFKKAGWDCFRHVEILAMGGIPYQPDVLECPDLAMSLYPKNLIATAHTFANAGLIAPRDLRAAIYSRFVERLTSEAMASFILSKTQFVPDRVIFLDDTMNTIPDYLSVMTYVGLKKLLGSEKVVAPLGAGPVFEDWTGNQDNLHGLGFGYCKVLSCSLRNSTEEAPADLQDAFEMVGPNDLLVAANINRSKALAELVSSAEIPEAHKLHIWGDDRSPNRSQLKWLKTLEGHVAIREVYSDVLTKSFLQVL